MLSSGFPDTNDCSTDREAAPLRHG